MDNIACWKASERADLFNASAAERGIIAAIIEKDFWVCWTLRHLFTLDAPPAGLIFKGGTSLSKAYRAIDRFSEDVDLSLQRADFGFGGENDPAIEKGSNERRRKLERLTEVCKSMVRDEEGDDLRRAADI
jgi:predicted nucleotidyltransferase component of viral defense system